MLLWLRGRGSILMWYAGVGFIISPAPKSGTNAVALVTHCEERAGAFGSRHNIRTIVRTENSALEEPAFAMLVNSVLLYSPYIQRGVWSR